MPFELVVRDGEELSIYVREEEGSCVTVREILCLNIPLVDCNTLVVKDAGDAKKLAELIEGKSWRRLLIGMDTNCMAAILSDILGLFGPLDIAKTESQREEIRFCVKLAELLQAAGVKGIIWGYTKGDRGHLLAFLAGQWKAEFMAGNTISTVVEVCPINKIKACIYEEIKTIVLTEEDDAG